MSWGQNSYNGTYWDNWENFSFDKLLDNIIQVKFLGCDNGIGFMREHVLAFRRYMLMCLGAESLIDIMFFLRGSDIDGREKQHTNVADVNDGVN